MKIQNFRTEQQDDTARIVATVSWEDSNRPVQEVYFSVPKSFTHLLSSTPHAFLVGAILPAILDGERRVSIDGEVCPQLAEGLRTVMSLMRYWYDPQRKLVQIEPKNWLSRVPQKPSAKAGFFFSGGVDSLTVLRRNRLTYPIKHPHSFKYGLLVYGLNVESDDRYETFGQAVQELSEVSAAADIQLVAIDTNLRRVLNSDTHFYIYEFHGATLTAAAHALAGDLRSVSIASTMDIAHLLPFGSHPILDANYGSSDLSVHHEDATLTRFDKTKIVADWDVALQNIKVCIVDYPGKNCGRCEKCVRTMLALLALGCLNQTRAFPKKNLSPEDVREVICSPYAATFYDELREPLAAIGRHDLVSAIDSAKARFRGEMGGVRGYLKRFDQQFLNGLLLKYKKLLLSAKPPHHHSIYDRASTR